MLKKKSRKYNPIFPKHPNYRNLLSILKDTGQRRFQNFQEDGGQNWCQGDASAPFEERWSRFTPARGFHLVADLA